MDLRAPEAANKGCLVKLLTPRNGKQSGGRGFKSRPVRMLKGKKAEKMTKKLEIQGHVLVPEHIKMNEAEVQKLLEKYNVTLKQLPKILRTDPALRNLDPKPGDVIKILRKSPTVGDVEFYRVVIHA